ncbi:universal stress protein [Lutibacter sp.]|uniref:universal stress protein n=1 Tax=Lutibacter sp. TaxID=1925666 RepID=UPI001A28EB8A|nr:universal stress protein [Lutibacter sp.]MBI9039762.1 universal stress protein [Lutibacter sp.]
MSFIINTPLFSFVVLIKAMRNILILTDFSSNSWNSIEYSLALFQNKAYNFYFLNASDIQEDEFEQVGIDNGVLATVKKVKDSKKEFNNLIKKINLSPLKGAHTFTTISVKSNLISAVKNQIKLHKIELIILGTNGLSTQGKMNIGSISEDIITKVKCSTLVVPKEARFVGLNEIAFPTDYTYFYEAKLLQNINNLLDYKKSTFRFVYVAKNSEVLDKEQLWNKETLHDYFINCTHTFHSEINKNLEISIQKVIDEFTTDIVIMAAKNLNLFEQILFRPKINSIKYYTKTPFLILH